MVLLLYCISFLPIVGLIVILYKTKIRCSSALWCYSDRDFFGEVFPSSDIGYYIEDIYMESFVVKYSICLYLQDDDPPFGIDIGVPYRCDKLTTRIYHWARTPGGDLFMSMHFDHDDDDHHRHHHDSHTSSSSSLWWWGWTAGGKVHMSMHCGPEEI